MKKLTFSLVVIACSFIFLFSACGNKVIKPDENGIAKAATGETLQATDRSFSVISAKKVEDFGGYTPLPKEQLIEVVIKTTNRSTETITLSEVDYQLQWGTDGFTDALASFDAQGELIPFETSIEKGQSVEYHYLYSVSSYIGSFSICYLDSNTNGNQNLFYSSFSI